MLKNLRSLTQVAKILAISRKSFIKIIIVLVSFNFSCLINEDLPEFLLDASN